MIFQCLVQGCVATSFPIKHMGADSILLLSVYILLLPIVVGMIRFRQLDGNQRLLLVMIGIVAVNQFISRWWIQDVTDNNLPFFYAYILVEFIFLSRIYLNYLPPFIPRKIMLVLVVIFSLVWLVTVFLPAQIWKYPTELRFLECLFILFYTGSYFVKVFREEKILHLERIFPFWLGAGLTVYFASNLLLFIFIELVILQALSIYKYIWVVHAILSIFLYISFTIALMCKKTILS